MTGKIFTNIIVFFLVVVLIFVAYGYFFSDSAKNQTVSDSALLVSSSENEGADGGVSGEEAVFLSLLEQVRNLDLEHGRQFLANPLFQQSLKNFSRPLPDRPVGRTNPFLPVNPAEAYRSAGTTTSP